MKPDHINPQGPGYGLPGGKRSLVALVCALAVLTLSACSRGEKSRFTDDSLAALVPAEAKMVFEVDVPTMLRTFETVTGEKVSATPEGPLVSFGDLVGESPPKQLIALMQAIDPVKNVRRFLFAGTPPEFLPRTRNGSNNRERQEHLMFLFEGNFGERSKIVETLVEVQILSSSDSDVVDGLEVYTCTRNFRPVNYLTFLSESRALLTSAYYLQKVVAIRKGNGESILSSEALKSLTDGFSTREPHWGAIFLSEEVKKEIGPPPGRRLQSPEREIADVILAPDAALLAVAPAGKDFSLRLTGVMPTPEKAAATSKIIDELLGELSPELTEQFGLLAIELLSRMTPKAVGNKVSISFKSSEAMVDGVKKLILQGRDRAVRRSCTSHLRSIYYRALAYAREAGNSEFPLDHSTPKPRAHDSLNLLLKSDPRGHLSPTFFKCPGARGASSSVEETAAPRSGFQLGENSLDYAWTTVSRSQTGPRSPPRRDRERLPTLPLAACAHHEGVLIVLLTDGSIHEWDLNDPEVKAMLDPETGLPEGLGR